MKPLIIANWKANQDLKGTISFGKELGSVLANLSLGVVICPPFPYLEALSSLAEEFNFQVGAQDISPFANGAFTGEVSASMLEGIVTHCIVGHSERWKYFGETSQSVLKKIEQLLGSSITPVLCISDLTQLDQYLEGEGKLKDASDKIIFVYEPPGAISGGGSFHPEDPVEVRAKISQIKQKVGSSAIVLYGGSVNADNIASFLAGGEIAGALVGQASLKIETFEPLLSAVVR